MKPLHILKTLANGWQVPYPEEVIYKDMLILKDYRLNGYPGEALPDYNIGYDEYVEWLQDYLIRCELDLTEEQRKIWDHISTDKYFDCASLGWDAGFYENSHILYPAYDFPDDFEETLAIDDLKGFLDDDPYAAFMEFDRDNDDPKPTRLEFILRDYGYLLLEKIEEIQFQQYWPGFVKLEPLHWIAGMGDGVLEPTDSAWRIYLALLLRRMLTKAERINGLNRFFHEYGDALHK